MSGRGITMTCWTVPGRGDTLGYLRALLSEEPRDTSDQRRTPLLVVWPDIVPSELDLERLREVERRAAAGEL